jgi:UDP:flavonoid glycosyltransferase YjiC (YdhE family)
MDYSILMPYSSSNVCLFIINGLGMGNCTRCDAIIENLLKSNVEIHVLTCGNGIKYFESNKSIASLTSMESFHYGSKGGKLSIRQTILSLPQYYKTYKSKTQQLIMLLEKIKPHIAVTDSEYAVLPLKKLKIPIIGLNNSEVIVTEYLRRNNLPKSIRFQFWFVEFLDYIYHRLVCDHIISPSINPIPVRNSKFYRVGLIVRNKVLDISRVTKFPHNNQEDPFNLVVMLSGSEFASHINFDSYDLPCKVEVVGRTGLNRGQIVYHGRLWDNTKKLDNADTLVINGGFSAVSEALVLKKYTLVIPVPGHAEQYINAVLLQESGWGEITSEEDVVGRLKNLFESGWEDINGKAKLEVNGNGAKEAAGKILSIFKDLH